MASKSLLDDIRFRPTLVTLGALLVAVVVYAVGIDSLLRKIEETNVGTLLEWFSFTYAHDGRELAGKYFAPEGIEVTKVGLYRGDRRIVGGNLSRPARIFPGLISSKIAGNSFEYRRMPDGTLHAGRSTTLGDGRVLKVEVVSSYRIRMLMRILLVSIAVAGAIAVAACIVLFRTVGRGSARLFSFISAVSEASVHDAPPAPFPGKAEYSEIENLYGIYWSLVTRLRAGRQAKREGMDLLEHEVGSSLTRIRLLLQQAHEPGSRAAAVERATQEVDRASEVMHRAVVLARGDPLDGRTSWTPFDLNGPVREAVGSPSILPARSRVELDLDEQIGLPVMGDRERLKIAIRNLIENALKYTPPHARILVRGYREGATAVIEVRDYGPGISAAELPHVWDRGYRGRSAAGSEGLGLGLSLTKQIVVNHGGSVRAAGKPNEGSTFAIVMPLYA
jgi:two-component system OmpR family sensor kinase/two-component system sensor histidine kinase QseC